MNLSWLLPGLRLGEPWALAALPLLALWAMHLRRLRRRRGGLTFPHSQLGELPRSWRVRLTPLPGLLRVMALVLLVLAAARPQLGRQREKIHQKGVDIILALDVSGSMRAEDILPNRLEAAKLVIHRFLSRLSTDRVGLIVFAGRSFTQCPLTTDYGVIDELLGECHIGMVQFDGTAIGEALVNCVYRFQSEAERRAKRTGGEGGEPRSRVVVLLTDGFNNTGRITPLEAAEMAKVKGIRVHCIGLGTAEGAPVPWMQGGVPGYLTNPDGSLLITRLDEPSLQAIAKLTGGQYFRATDARALDSIYRRIGEMEQHAIEIEKVTHHEERFIVPLVAGAAILLLELLLRATALRVHA